MPALSWVYLPYPEQGPANRITFLSNYSPANAPPGKTSILAEATVAGTEPPADPDGIVREVEEGLERCGLLRRAEICQRSVAYCRYAYILYDRDFDRRNASILDGLDRMGLWSVGRFARYEYWNSDQVVMAARKLADRIVAAR